MTKPRLGLAGLTPAEITRLETRFWAKVDAAGDCWEWTAHTSASGYGVFRVRCSVLQAHRVAYELLAGPAPADLVHDHLCRNRSCVNPDHAEYVTEQENILRGAGLAARRAAQTTCKRGHSFDRIATSGQRICTTCRKLTARSPEQRLKSAERLRKFRSKAAAA